MARIGIYLADIAYAGRLSQLFGREGYEVYLYQQEEELAEAVHRHSLELLVLEEGSAAPPDIPVLRPVARQEEEKPSVPPPVSVGSAAVPSSLSLPLSSAEERKEIRIWRYSGRDRWLQAIRDQLRVPPRRRYSGGLRSASIWLVYAASGRCLKTTLAYLCAQLLAGAGKSLVIGSGFALPGEETLTALCYALRHGLPWQDRLAAAVVTEGGQAYVKAGRLTENYATVTTEEWQQLSSALYQLGYTHLVIDAGSSFRLAKQWWPLVSGCLYPTWQTAPLEMMKEELQWQELTAREAGKRLHSIDLSQLTVRFQTAEDVWGCTDERMLQRLHAILKEEAD